MRGFPFGTFSSFNSLSFDSMTGPSAERGSAVCDLAGRYRTLFHEKPPPSEFRHAGMTTTVGSKLGVLTKSYAADRQQNLFRANSNRKGIPTTTSGRGVRIGDHKLGSLQVFLIVDFGTRQVLIAQTIHNHRYAISFHDRIILGNGLVKRESVGEPRCNHRQ